MAKIVYVGGIKKILRSRAQRNIAGAGRNERLDEKLAVEGPRVLQQHGGGSRPSSPGGSAAVVRERRKLTVIPCARSSAEGRMSQSSAPSLTFLASRAYARLQRTCREGVVNHLRPFALMILTHVTLEIAKFSVPVIVAHRHCVMLVRRVARGQRRLAGVWRGKWHSARLSVLRRNAPRAWRIAPEISRRQSRNRGASVYNAFGVRMAKWPSLRHLGVIGSSRVTARGIVARLVGLDTCAARRALPGLSALRGIGWACVKYGRLAYNAVAACRARALHRRQLQQ